MFAHGAKVNDKDAYYKKYLGKNIKLGVIHEDENYKALKVNLYSIKGIEANLTKDQVDQILAIVEKANNVKF